MNDTIKHKSQLFFRQPEINDYLKWSFIDTALVWQCLVQQAALERAATKVTKQEPPRSLLTDVAILMIR